jgi:hypothetical protein
MALSTVAQLVALARTLTQDTVAPYRYADPDFVTALNAGLLESRRLRPDFYAGSSVPSYSTVDTTAVTIDEQYRLAFVYYMCGMAQLRDEEETQDTRAAAFMALFERSLTSRIAP